MNILFVTSEYGYGHGGWERYSRGVVSAVQSFASTRVLVYRKTNGTTDPTIVEVLPDASFSLRTQLQVFQQVFRACRREHVDLIHVLVEPYALGASIAAYLNRVPFTMTLHGTYSVPPRGWGMHTIIRRALIALTYRFATIVTTGSLGTETKVREHVYLPECIFIPNGVDNETFHQIPGTTKEPFILTVGMLKPRKGADLGVRVTAQLVKTIPNIRYKLVGDISNTAFVEEVRQLANAEGIVDRVDFLGGIPDEELAKLYNQAMCMLLPARDAHGAFEGFPMVFYEANACGTPVVTTRGFGSEYAIKDGVNGYLVNQEDVDAMVSSIKEMFQNNETYHALIVGSLNEAHQHSWPVLSKKFQDFYARARSLKSHVTG